MFDVCLEEKRYKLKWNDYMYLPRWMKIKTTNNFCMFTADYAIKRYWSLVNKRSRIAYCSIDNIFVLMSCEMKSAY